MQLTALPSDGRVREPRKNLQASFGRDQDMPVSTHMSNLENTEMQKEMKTIDQLHVINTEAEMRKISQLNQIKVIRCYNYTEA